MVRRKPTSRKKKSGCGCLSGLLLLAFLAATAAAAAGAWLVLTPFGPTSERFVEIAPGSSTLQIARKLEAAGIVRSRYAFHLVRWLKRGQKGSLKAGEYRFDHPVTALEVYARILRGDVFTIAVTIPEGSNLFDIAALLDRAKLSTRESFLDVALHRTTLIADLDPKATSLEGYLFPDTYRFARKATSAQIAAAMIRRFRTVTAPLDLKQAHLSTHQLVTLASLIEKETAVDADRPLVASVFANRLARKMPLMTDPTIIYGLERAAIWRGKIYASDLKRDTPYNTYLHEGLPPGPIANPGLKSLRAALAPPASNYLYFVAVGANAQGGSHFSATLNEHNQAVAVYRRAVQQGGVH